MSSYILRKVQLTGGSTYIVSLPKNWAELINLKPGDYVQLMPQPDNSLLLIPRQEREEALEAEIRVSANELPEEVARELIACYLAGYDTIRIIFGARVSEFKSYLKNLMRTKLIGLESVEESADHMLVRCLMGHVDFPIKEALNRIYLMSLSMLRDALKALKERDLSLARDVIQRDDEVDRLYLFCVRELKAAVGNAVIMREAGLKNARECLGYRLIVKSIERIADHAAGIASQIHLLKLKEGSQTINGIVKLGEAVSMIYEKVMESVFGADVKRANKLIVEVGALTKLENDLLRKIFQSKLNTETAIGLRMIIEGIRRIAEYSADIAEIVINLAVKG